MKSHTSITRHHGHRTLKGERSTSLSAILKNSNTLDLSRSLTRYFVPNLSKILWYRAPELRQVTNHLKLRLVNVPKSLQEQRSGLTILKLLNVALIIKMKFWTPLKLLCSNMNNSHTSVFDSTRIVIEHSSMLLCVFGVFMSWYAQ